MLARGIAVIPERLDGTYWLEYFVDITLTWVQYPRAGAGTMYVFRIHIRPQGGLADPGLSFAYCLKNDLLGVGWSIPKNEGEAIEWKTYEKRATEKYVESISGVRYIHKWVTKGDLVWTRDTKGHYYLCRVLSPWEYFDGQEARDADIVNIFRVKYIKVDSIDEVPGSVIASFRARRVIQEVANKTAVIYSKYLWNTLSGTNEYEIDKIHSLWDMLSDEQVEDLIFLYLQTKNWYVIPNSRKKDTMAYEFYLIHKIYFNRAIVQAKTGNSYINFDDYQDYNETVFMFQPNALFSGTKKNNMIVITNNELELFVEHYNKIIPANILKWLALMKSIR